MICALMFHKWWWLLYPGLQPSSRKTYLLLAPCCFLAKWVQQQWDLICSSFWTKRNNDSMAWGFKQEKQLLQKCHAEAVNTLLCFSFSINVPLTVLGRWKWCLKLFFNSLKWWYYLSRTLEWHLFCSTVWCVFEHFLWSHKNIGIIQTIQFMVT